MSVKRLPANSGTCSTGSNLISGIHIPGMVAGAAFLLTMGLTQTSKTQMYLPPVLNPFGLDSTTHYALPAAVDMDEDGDLDLFVGEYLGLMYYFQDTTIVTATEALVAGAKGCWGATVAGGGCQQPLWGQ